MSANPTVTTIHIPHPDAAELHLRLAVGACRVFLRPGDVTDAWVTGTYRDPSGRRPSRILTDGGTVRITWSDNPLEEMFGAISGAPVYDLTVSKARPFALTIETGASEFEIDLGGLPLTALTLRQGAGRYEINFSAPNPQPMNTLSIAAGAGSVEAKNLANANFAQMTLEGGAAGYKFDFGGALQRDGNVRINTGVASVDLTVPASTATKLYAESMLGGLDIGDGYMKKEGAFWNEAALAGKTPQLTIRANVVLGSLELKNV